MARLEKPRHTRRRSALLDRAQRWHPVVRCGDDRDVALSIDPGRVGIGEATVLADDGIPDHVRSLAPQGVAAESQVAVVRLRQMEIPGWWCGYVEWESQVAWCGYVEWRSPARAACGNRLGAGRALRTATTSPFGKTKTSYPERTRGDSLSPRLLPAGQPHEHESSPMVDARLPDGSRVNAAARTATVAVMYRWSLPNPGPVAIAVAARFVPVSR